MNFSTLVSVLNMLLAPSLALNCTTASFQSFLDSTNITATVANATTLGDNSTFVVTDNEAYPESPTGLRALCAVQVNVTSDVNSHYSFGLFFASGVE